MDKESILILSVVALIAVVGMVMMEGMQQYNDATTGYAVMRRSKLPGVRTTGVQPSQTSSRLPTPPPTPQSISPTLAAPSSGTLDKSVVGSWRVYSQAIFYDKGGNNWLSRPSTRKLTLSADGTWDYGTKGTWTVNAIKPGDWKKWKIEPYGPTKKIVLQGWNNAVADGPIEGNDFVWVIYHSKGFSSLGPALIQMKFGH